MFFGKKDKDVRLTDKQYKDLTSNMSKMERREFERRQDDVDRTAGQRDLVDFSLPLGGAILDGLFHLLRSLGHSWFLQS